MMKSLVLFAEDSEARLWVAGSDSSKQTQEVLETT